MLTSQRYAQIALSKNKNRKKKICESVPKIYKNSLKKNGEDPHFEIC